MRTRCAAVTLAGALLLVALLICAAARPDQDRSEAFIGYGEKANDVCEDELQEEECQGYKDAGMCNTGACGCAAALHLLTMHRASLVTYTTLVQQLCCTND